MPWLRRQTRSRSFTAAILLALEGSESSTSVDPLAVSSENDSSDVNAVDLETTSLTTEVAASNAENLPAPQPSMLVVSWNVEAL